jgi:hypothetical protein
MLLPRRKFLRSSLLFGASAVLVFGNARHGLASALLDDNQLPPEVLRDPVYSFTKETFEPYVGGYFEAPNARGEMVALKLLQVESYVPKANTKMSTRSAVLTESFSLLFSAAAPLPLLTSIHTIKHGALGKFRLFLTRGNGPNREIYYEAVFNHLR